MSFISLRERGFAPRKLGHDSWESRCPGHRSSDHSLSITRNEFNHVVLECRTTENCQHIRIIRRSVLRTNMCTQKPPIG